MTLVAGLVLAVVSAGLLNVSFFLQHRASNRLDALVVRHPIRSFLTLLSNPAWLLAYGGGWVGWALYVAALRLAPLSVVQAISAGGLPLLAVLAHRFGTGVTRHERVAASIGALAVALVCASLGVQPTSGRGHLEVVLGVVVGGVLLASLVVGCVALASALKRTGPAQRFLGPGAALGTAAGLLYAVSDVAAKGAVNGTGIVLVPLFLLVSALGFGALQLAFQRGGVLQTAGLSSLITTVVPIAAGVGLYREHLPAGPAGWGRAGGFALSVIAAVVLAAGRSSGPSPAADPLGAAAPDTAQQRSPADSQMS